MCSLSLMVKFTIIIDSNILFSNKKNTRALKNILVREALNEGVIVYTNHWVFNSEYHFNDFKLRYSSLISVDEQKEKKRVKEMDDAMRNTFIIWFLCPVFIYMYFRYSGVLVY